MRTLILILLLVAPLPFASARPVWHWMWVTYIAVLAGYAGISAMLGRGPLSNINHLKQLPRLPLVLAGMFLSWCFFQAIDLGAIGASWVPQVSDPAIDTLLKVQGSLSISSETTIDTGLRFLSHGIFFILCFAACKTRPETSYWIKVLAIFSACYAAYGFIAHTSGSNRILWYEKWASPNALSSTFVNKNHFATFAAIGMVTASCWLSLFYQEAQAHDSGRRQAFAALLDKTMKGGWLPLVILFLLSTTLLLSGSRAGFVAAVGGLVVFAALHAKLSISKIWRGAAVSAAAAIILFAISGNFLVKQFEALNSDNMRVAIYRNSLNAVTDRPMTGFGLGTFEQIYPVYRKDVRQQDILRGHNEYLELAMTTGIPATFLLLAAFASLIATQFRAIATSGVYRPVLAWSLGCSAVVGAHSLVDFPMQIPAISYLIIAIIALGTSVATRTLSETVPMGPHKATGHRYPRGPMAYARASRFKTRRCLVQFVTRRLRSWWYTT